MTQAGFDADKVRSVAAEMRRDIVAMIAEAGSGHPGGSLSAADVVATLFFGGILRHDPNNPDWPARDRFVLSKGHTGPVLYAALAHGGYFGRTELVTLRKLGSILQGHPDKLKTPGVEVSTGSLGQGLSVSCGIAAGLASDGYSGPDADARTVYTLLGDGELQEGQVWEAAMFASHRSLANLVAIVDYNGLQIDGACNEVMCLGDVSAKFSAFGWKAAEVDGHDVEALHAAITTARDQKDGPAVVIAHTIKGKGVSFMEGDPGWHGKAPDADETARALAELDAVIQKGADRG